MPDGLKTFFDTYANAFVAVGAIVGVLTLLFAIFAYYLPRRDPPENGQKGNTFREKRNSKIVYAARILAAALARGATLAWRYARGLASKSRLAALYYIPGIKYEVPSAPEILDDAVAAELRESNIFFSERFADAFPAISNMTSFTRTSDIAHRLDILLRPPLTAWDEGHTRSPTPVWWFRGMGNLHIYRWGRVKPGLFLMNNMELDISRIIAIPGVAYWQNFVYVECRALPQVGLYSWTDEDLLRKSRQGHGYEEYAIYGHRIYNRQQYDDGGYEVRGRVKHFLHSPQLRVRHITPFNFVIAPVMSPVNVTALDRELDRRLRLCRENPADIAQLTEWLLSLPRRSEPH